MSASGTCHALTTGGSGRRGKSLVFIVVALSCLRETKSTRRENGKLTNGNHTLIIIIQILSDDLQQSTNTLSTTLTFHTQVLILYLHFAEGIGQSSHDSFVRLGVELIRHHNSEVEHEFIALILLVGDVDGVAYDYEFTAWIADRDEAITKCWTWDNEF